MAHVPQRHCDVIVQLEVIVVVVVVMFGSWIVISISGTYGLWGGVLTMTGQCQSVRFSYIIALHIWLYVTHKFLYPTSTGDTSHQRGDVYFQ